MAVKPDDEPVTRILHAWTLTSSIFNREMLIAATGRRGLWGNRGFFAGLLLTVILATFGARYYWDHAGTNLRPRPIDGARRVRGAFPPSGIIPAHIVVIFGVFWEWAAPSIALEKDRRTLDFLLATRLTRPGWRAAQTPWSVTTQSSGGRCTPPERGCSER